MDELTLTEEVKLVTQLKDLSRYDLKKVLASLPTEKKEEFAAMSMLALSEDLGSDKKVEPIGNLIHSLMSSMREAYRTATRIMERQQN